MFNKERPDVLFKHNTYGGKLAASHSLWYKIHVEFYRL